MGVIAILRDLALSSELEIDLARTPSVLEQRNGEKLTAVPGLYFWFQVLGIP